MSEINANPISSLHHDTEAEFQAYDQLEIVSTFGEPQAEYAALRKGCGLMDLPQRGLLRVEGKDRLDFLNRLLSNQIVDKQSKTAIAAGAGVYSFMLNNKGRIISDMTVLERGEFAWVQSDARNIATIQSTMEKFVFSEKVSFVFEIGKMHQIALNGPKAAAALESLGAAVGDLKPLGSTAVSIGDIPVTIWRDDLVGNPGYNLIVENASAAKLWQFILDRNAPEKDAEVQTAKRQVWPVGWAAFNSVRIEAGRPLFGIDFDATVLPAETPLEDRAVSFTKGCYPGQEIVARMKSRGQAVRKIVGLKMADSSLPLAGAAIYDDDQNQVGGLTSSTISPILSNAAIGLGMVKQSHFAVGSKVRIPAEGAIRLAEVVELPFVKS